MENLSPKEIRTYASILQENALLWGTIGSFKQQIINGWVSATTTEAREDCWYKMQAVLNFEATVKNALNVTDEEDAA